MDEKPFTAVPSFIKGVLIVGALAALVTLAVEHMPEVEKLIEPEDKGPKLLLLECNPEKQLTDEFSVRCEVELERCNNGFLTMSLWQGEWGKPGGRHLSSGGVDPMSELAGRLLRHLGNGPKDMTLRLKYNFDGEITTPDFIIVGVDSWD